MCDTSIHSGHFMVSSLSEDNEIELPPGLKGYNFETANHQLSNTYSFGGHEDELQIDASLHKLFDCMTLAYRAKLVSPKWKHFRGIDVKLKDKIRLNNLIWREWHMQFRQKKNSVICQFEIPVGDMTHSKPEAVVLEGKYWKRRFYFCTTEYRKWRQFYKDHFIQPRNSLPANEQVAPPVALTPLEFPHVASSNGIEMAGVSRQISNDEFMADLPNLLFSSVLPAFAFPDPKEIPTWGLPDIVQPGLIQLQPSYDDFFMDTIEPLSMATDVKPTINSVAQQQTTEHDFLRPFSTNQSNVQTFSGNKRSNMPSDNQQSLWSTALRTNVNDDRNALWSQQDLLLDDSKQNFSTAQSLPMAVSSDQMSKSIASTPEQSSQCSAASVETVRSRGPALKHSAVLGPVWPGMISRMKMGQNIAASVVQKSQSDGRLSTLKNSNESIHRKMTPPKGSQPAVLKALLLDKHDTLPQTSPPGGGLQKVQRGTAGGSALPKTSSGSHLALQQKTALRVRRCSLESVSTAFSGKISDTGQLKSIGPLAGDNGVSQQSPWQQQQQQQQPPQQQQQPQQQQRGRQRQVSFTDEVTTVDSGGGVSSVGVASEEKPGIVGNQKNRIMTAEYRRRCMIKNSFETLNHLVPSLHSADSGKINKAVILLKAAEYCQRMKDEKELMLREISELQKEISTLQNDISCFQLQLPATGAAPVTQSSLPHHMVQLYDSYVQSQTLVNWKFWIFNLIIQQLFETYVSAVSSVKTDEEFDRGILSWIQFHCSLVSLRPVVLVSLRKLSTSTSILTDPSLVPRQAKEAATKRDN